MVTERQLNSPKRYLYEICDKLGMKDSEGNARLPVSTDTCAGGYKLQIKANYLEKFHGNLPKEMEEMTEADWDAYTEEEDTFMQEAGKRLLEKIIMIADELSIKCWKPRVTVKSTFRGDYWVAAICVPRYEA